MSSVLASKVPFIAVFCLAGWAHSQPVLIESSTADSDPVPNLPNEPYYKEFGVDWHGSNNQSKAPCTPPLSTTYSRQNTNGSGVPSFTYYATNEITLQVGVKYVVQVTTPTSSSQPPPGDLVVSVSATGLASNTLPATTTAFSLSGIDKWTSLGEVICSNSNPTFTFTYVSGSIGPTPTRRFYAQCIRLIPQDQTNGIRTWTGGAGVADPMWNNPTNWGGVAPRLGGDDIEFDGNEGLLPIADGPFSVNSMKFLAGAGKFSLGSTNYNTYAGPISIATTNGVSNLSTNDQVIYTPIRQGAVPLVVDTGTKMLSISNTIDGTAGYSVRGNGTLFLRVPGNGVNPITGPILVSTGATLRLARYGAAGSTAPGAGDLTLDGGTLANEHTSTLAPMLGDNRNIVVGPGGATLDVPGSTLNQLYEGVITNGAATAPLVKAGSGRLVLGGNAPNSYNADTIVNAGRLVLSKTSSNAIASNLYVAGGIVQLTYGDQIADSAIVNVTSGILGFQGAISDTVTEIVLNGGAITGAVATLTANHFDVRSGTNTTQLAGGANLDKTTYGVVLLSGNNFYTGTTTVSGGKLIINGSIGPGQVIVTGGTLAGNSTITGQVEVQSGGTLSPGLSVGRMTLSSGLTLQSGGVIYMELDKSAGTNDLVSGLTNVNYGGILTVTNLSGMLTTNDTFKLFDSTSYGGTFESLNLPPLAMGLSWDASGLTNDGTIKVVESAPPPQQPQITNVMLNASKFVMSGVGGSNNGDFFVRASTNVGWPISNWTIIATGQFGAAGQFSWTNPVSPGVPQNYFILQTP